MSFKLMAKAMNVKTGGPIPKLILLKLCDNANDAGVCWPSNSSIAEECEITRRTVINNIEKLVKQGLLSKETRAAGSGRTTSNSYLITLGGYVNNIHREGEGDSQGGVNMVHPHYIEPTIINLPSEQKYIKENLEVSQQAIISVAGSCFSFDDFWNAYDYKMGKPKCIKYYSKIVETDRALIKKHVIRYVDSTMKPSKPEQGKVSRKHPGTYLYQECWNDELDVEEPTGFKDNPSYKVYQRSSGAYAVSGVEAQDKPLLQYPVMCNDHESLFFWNGQQVLFDVEDDCYTLDGKTPIDPDGWEAGHEHCARDIETSIKNFQKELALWRDGKGAE